MCNISWRLFRSNKTSAAEYSNPLAIPRKKNHTHWFPSHMAVASFSHTCWPNPHGFWLHATMHELLRTTATTPAHKLESTCLKKQPRRPIFSLTLETACIKLRSASTNTRSWIQNLFFAPVPTLSGHSKCLYEAACETAWQQEGSKALDSWLRVVGHCLLWNTCCFFCRIRFSLENYSVKKYLWTERPELFCCWIY